VGSLRPARSVFDVSPDNDRDAALIRAAKLARANGKLVAWDNSERDYAIALYDEQTHQVQPLTDEEAAILLNREVLIRRAWRKWNAASKNRGSLVVLDSERALRMLAAPTEEPDEDDEVRAWREGVVRRHSRGARRLVHVRTPEEAIQLLPQARWTRSASTTISVFATPSRSE
jgi:hypothetical protein